MFNIQVHFGDLIIEECFKPTILEARKARLKYLNSYGKVKKYHVTITKSEKFKNYAAVNNQ